MGGLRFEFSALPAKRQTLLFTATNSETVAETIKVCPNNPFDLKRLTDTQPVLVIMSLSKGNALTIEKRTGLTFYSEPPDKVGLIQLQTAKSV